MRLLGMPLIGILQACIGPALVFATASTYAEVPLQTQVVTFDSLKDGLQGSSILANTGGTQIFSFNATVAIYVQHVSLLDHSNNKTIAESESQFSSGVSFNLFPLGGQRWEIDLYNASSIVTGGEAGDILYFEVAWSYTAYAGTFYNGTSYSIAFTFANSFDNVKDTGPFYNEAPYKAETVSSSVSSGTSTATTAQVRLGSSSSVTLATLTSIVSPSSGVPQQSMSRHKGLNGGAIAGVAIGVVAGLAAIAVLLWFFFNRRHRHSHGYSSPQHARSTGPDAIIDIVPHSVGGHGEDVGVGAGLGASAGVGTGTDADAVAADVVIAADVIAAEKGRAAGMTSSVSERDGGANSPYSDEFDSVTDNHGAGSLAAADAGVSLPVVSDHVVALIEDGMTPEDVARLAAEEMELDAAIHNANLIRATEITEHQ